MLITNRYVKNSKISEAKFREIMKYFAFDLDAQTIALLTKLNRNTVNRYRSLIRQRIADLCEEESPFHGEIEVDESYFGAKRIKEKRSRGVGRRTPVFGILQQKGGVYTEIVPDCARKTSPGHYQGQG